MSEKLPPQTDYSVSPQFGDSGASNWDDRVDALDFDEVGLPTDYDPRFIPDGSVLAHAAIQALHRETAFVILNKDEPRAIAQRLEEIASVVLAACEVRGPHLPKAIRLGLALRPEYWVARGQMDKWLRLLAVLLIKAIATGDSQLQSEVYGAWSIYLYLTNSRAKARQALEAALEYASDARRDDLALVMRAERLNVDAETLSLPEAHVAARSILASAQQQQFHYVLARVYQTLARVYLLAELNRTAFMYAQQSLIYAQRAHDWTLVGECILFMVMCLQHSGNRANAYTGALLRQLATLARLSTSSYVHAGLCYGKALRLYDAEQVSEARRCALHAWVIYRGLERPRWVVGCRHLLGLIRARSGRWRAAERHLRAAQAGHLALNDYVLATTIRQELAGVFLQEGNPQRALAELLAVREEVLALTTLEARHKRLAEVDAAISGVREILGTAQPGQAAAK